MMTDTIEVYVSSGNVFADLGLQDADMLLVKANAIVFLLRQLDASGMRRSELARRAGLSKSNVSELLSGRMHRFGIERINKLMAVFGARIEAHYTLHLPSAVVPSGDGVESA